MKVYELTRIECEGHHTPVALQQKEYVAWDFLVGGVVVDEDIPAADLRVIAGMFFAAADIAEGKK